MCIRDSHIQTVDQAAAVKSIKAKVSDIDKMKVEEQKKAARAGYDMDILPPDLVTYSNEMCIRDSRCGVGENPAITSKDYLSL